ncbi:hypothetical protein V2O64_20095 [Verrucomicrobiaceae bacterium 227]
MKWIVLSLLCLFLVIFWPRKEHRNPTETRRTPSAVKASQSSRSLSPPRKTPGLRLTQVSDDILRDRILKIWPKIENDLPGRDPSLVEFIRTLRELGRRDGLATLSFLDQLDRTNKESAWIRARVAVAGGWALSDPEEASLALLKKDHVLPSDFSKYVMGPTLGSRDPCYLAITQAALPIFERWAAEAPDRARQFANEEILRRGGWGFGVFGQFAKVTNPDRLHSSDPGAINAILNNPDLTVPEFKIGPDDSLTDEMQAVGELAFTQSEWAARNPNQAREIIAQSQNFPESLVLQVLIGLARNERNYQNIMSLAPPSLQMNLAEVLLESSISRPAELIWQLDERESTWQLPAFDRRQAAQELFESELFTQEEQNELQRRDSIFIFQNPVFTKRQIKPD